MTIARDQLGALNGGTSAVTSFTVTWATSPAAGATVLVAFAVGAGTNVVSSVVDNGTSQSTFTADVSYLDSVNGYYLYIYRADGISLPASGSYTVTITMSTASYVTAAGYSYTGIKAGAPTAVNSGGATGTSVSTGSVTPSAAGALYFATMCDGTYLNPETITLTATGFTDQAVGADGAAYIVLAMADKIDSSGPAATECTWTLGDSTNWNALIAAYDAASSGVTSTGSASLTSMTAAGTGTVLNPVTSSGSAALAAMAAAGTGHVPVIATGSASLTSMAAAGTGTVSGFVTSTGSASLAAMTAAGTGQVPVIATGSVSLTVMVAAGTGTETITSAGSVSLAVMTAAGTGAETITSTGSASLTSMAASGTVTVLNPTGNTAYGIISTWDGEQWIPYQAGPGAIFPGAITAAKIAANTITAAQIDAADIIANVIDGATITGNVINGATFNGTDWVENAAGSFYYSSAPAAGNMILSIASAAGTDAHGNSYPAGLTAYGTGGARITLAADGTDSVLQFTPPGVTSLTVLPEVFSQALNTGAADEYTWLILSSGKESGLADAALQLNSESADSTIPAKAVIEFGGTVMSTFASDGGLTVTDGADGQNYATQRRTLYTSGSVSLASSPGTTIFSSAVGIRSYRVHAVLYVSASTAAQQLSLEFGIPGSSTGTFAVTVARAAALVAATEVSGNSLTGIGASGSLAAGDTYMVTVDGMFTATSTGTFYLIGAATNSGDLTAAEFSFVDIMVI